MKELIAISAVVFIFGIANASAEVRPPGANVLDSAKSDVAYYYSRRRGRYIRSHTFPSGQRYTSRGGPYLRYILPGGGRTGPIPRSARGGG